MNLENWEQRFKAMIEHLEAESNVTIDHLSIDEGLTEEALNTLEERFGKAIPPVVRAFYQRFGSIKLIWQFKAPFISGKSTYVNSNAFCLHSGQHQGSIHIMPLERVLSTDWRKEQHNIPTELDLKIFDYYSLYHMLAFDVDSGDDPIIYLGEDHGAGFDRLALTFSDYLNVLVSCYGYINRFRHLEFWTKDLTGSLLNEANLAIAKTEFLALDFSNQHQIDAFVKEQWERINEAMQAKEYDKAYDIASDQLWKYDLKANGVVLDVLAIKSDEGAYFEWLGYALDDGFDLEAYEAATTYTKFIETERYQKLKAGK